MSGVYVEFVVAVVCVLAWWVCCVSCLLCGVGGVAVLSSVFLRLSCTVEVRQVVVLDMSIRLP